MTDRRTLLAGLFGMAAVAPLRATETPIRPAADPNRLSLWTSAALGKGIGDLLRRFEKTSGIHVAVTARGSDLAMAALYTGRADVALLGRTATDAERQAFEWVRQYPATEVALAADRLPGASPPVALLVNRQNPIRSLTPQRVADLLLSTKPIPWRDLGVAGPLGARPVRVHIPSTDNGTGRFLRAALVNGRNQLAWDRIVEHPGDGASAAIAKAVEADPSAIGFGNATAHARVVPFDVGGALLAPGAAGYPLARKPYLYLERPLADVRPPVRAFVDFLRSVA